MVGFVVGVLACVVCLALGIAAIAAAARAERLEREGLVRAEIGGFRDVVDRLRLGERLVLVGLVGWGLSASSLVWLWLGIRSLIDR